MSDSTTTVTAEASAPKLSLMPGWVGEAGATLTSAFRTTRKAVETIELVVDCTNRAVVKTDELATKALTIKTTELENRLKELGAA